MKTFKSKIIAGIIGAVLGLWIGHLFCVFVAGVLDPFAFHIYKYDYAHDVYLNIRDYALEGFARFFWVFTATGAGVGGSAFAVYLVNKR